ncbi:hypothetical protein GGS21DRAFT_545129 [Xylaria nigripes]|nr:hypothetical protein GGS21DRAFT_545129 [Xylaria nigripes]
MTSSSSDLTRENSVDPAQIPAIPKADGVVLKNGKFRCNLCSRTLQNKKSCISSHRSKHHPRDPSTITAYMKHKLYTCNLCGENSIGKEALKTHQRSAHQLLADQNPVPVQTAPNRTRRTQEEEHIWDAPLEQLKLQANTDPYIWMFWHSLVRREDGRGKHLEVS